MQKFIIESNSFLSHECVGYFNRFYIGYDMPGNPDFLNILKNQYQSVLPLELEESRDEVTKSAVVVTVPRSKANMARSQMGFRLAVQEGVNAIRNRGFREFEDGTMCIERHTNTRTTHLRKDIPNFVNSGDMPYPGITKETCHINSRLVRGKTVILVDDIYTRTVNVDEDCIQALYDAGAERVILYTVAYTKRRQG